MDELERFGELVNGPASPPLDEACLLVAGALHGDVDLAHELARLDDLAARVDGDTLLDVVALLFRTEGFTGDQPNYYDPRNSFLPCVLDRRLGIPISVA